MGSGYSVEGQLTGKEKFGGLHIEVIPSYRPNLKVWAHALKAGEPEQVHFPTLEEENTPAGVGLKPSDKLRAYPFPCKATVPLKISDLAKQISSAKICLYSPHRSPPPGHPHPVDDFFTSQSGWKMSGLSRKKRRSAGRSSDFDLIDRVHPMENSLDPDPDTATPLDLLYRTEYSDEPRVSSKPEVGSATTHVKATNLRAMGLAAGGKMIQDIVRDSNEAAIWNLQNAKLMNVHILDPASCEQVTHIVPGPPIDAQTYIDADLPFFVVEENPDNRLDEGDFDQVASVSEMDKKIGATTEPEFDPNKPKMCEECSLRLCDCM